ncbi:hypothetical protein SORBI_3K044408 [Sorghum bicolor]|uniref:Uncharacterized protein n=1 Tax=Sorghum bicolor TaxID=4558 RepID=A0A1W0VQN4_SORBI|nr:hypothetical protein SORBI_3K044408 [Sorghum bicolor]
MYMFFFAQITWENGNAPTNSINQRPEQSGGERSQGNGVSAWIGGGRSRDRRSCQATVDGCAASSRSCIASQSQEGREHDGTHGRRGERGDRARRDGGRRRRLLGLVVRVVRCHRRCIRRGRGPLWRVHRRRRRCRLRSADVELRRHQEAVHGEEAERDAVDDRGRDAGPGLAGVERDVVALGDHLDVVLGGQRAERALDGLERRLGVVGRQGVELEELGEVGFGHGLDVRHVLGAERVVVDGEQGEALVHGVLVRLEHARGGGQRREHLAAGALQEAGEVGGGRDVEEAVELDGRRDLEDGELERVRLHFLGDGADPGARGGRREAVVLVLLVHHLDVARGLRGVARGLSSTEWRRSAFLMAGSESPASLASVVMASLESTRMVIDVDCRELISSHTFVSDRMAVMLRPRTGSAASTRRQATSAATSRCVAMALSHTHTTHPDRKAKTS